MITLDDVDTLLDGLDGVRRRDDGWYVGGRLVARRLDDESLVVRTDFAEREALVAEHPESFSVPPEMEAHMKVCADLVRGDRDAIRAALRAAWELQAR